MNGFSLIRGVGIFPTQDMGPVMPTTEDRIRLDITRPNTSNEEFRITLIRETELVLGFTLRNGNNNLKKNEEPETYYDEDRASVVATPREFTETELLQLAENEDESVNVLGLSQGQMEKLRKKFKFYKKTLAAQEEYDVAKSTVPSGPETTTDEVMAAMERIKELQPSESERAKQDGRIKSICETLQEAVDALIGEDAESMDSAISRIFGGAPDDEHDSKVKQLASSMLAAFYDDNFRDPASFGETIASLKNPNSGALRNRSGDTKKEGPRPS